jgi:hypothetical protein
MTDTTLDAAINAAQEQVYNNQERVVDPLDRTYARALIAKLLEGMEANDAPAMVTSAPHTWQSYLFGYNAAITAAIEASGLVELIPLADAVLDHADSHCRWFDISTVPRGQWVITYRTGDKRATMAQLGFGDEWISPSGHTTVTSHTYLPPTHWRPLPPPPSNPPLPEVFTQLGQALEKLKEGR